MVGEREIENERNYAERCCVAKKMAGGSKTITYDRLLCHARVSRIVKADGIETAAEKSPTETLGNNRRKVGLRLIRRNKNGTVYLSAFFSY